MSAAAVASLRRALIVRCFNVTKLGRDVRRFGEISRAAWRRQELFLPEEVMIDFAVDRQGCFDASAHISFLF